MLRNVFLAGMIIVTGALSISLPSFAQSSVAKEVIWFRSVQTSLSKSAAKCGLNDPNILATHLSQQLQAIGITRNPKSRIVATLSIAAQSFGILSTQCVYNLTFQLQSFLNAQEITTPDPRVRAALSRLGHLPVSIYQDGIFGVVVLSGSPDGSESMRIKVKEAISTIVGRLRVARAR